MQMCESLCDALIDAIGYCLLMVDFDTFSLTFVMLLLGVYCVTMCDTALIVYQGHGRIKSAVPYKTCVHRITVLGK